MAFLTIWSFRDELKYVLFAFILFISLPVISVVVLTHTGIDAISDALITAKVGTKAIQIKNPIDGSIVKEIYPIVVWPVNGVITLNFGESDLPYQPFHTGIDIANASGRKGDPIIAFMSGKITYAREISWGYGKHIIIDNGDNISSVYAHLDKILVAEGQTVNAGSLIGIEGSTGWSTGPHLHFEVRVYGIPVNPTNFF